MTFNFLWYIGAALAIILIVIAADLLLRRRVQPECPLCGTRLNEENTVLQNNAENICVECYAKQMCPEAYEIYYTDR